jgi:hypothetical protein
MRFPRCVVVAAVASALLPLGASLHGCRCSDAREDGDDDGEEIDAGPDAETNGEPDAGYLGPEIPTTCAGAVEARTSVGCEFFGADLDNYSGGNEDPDRAPYVMVISNPQQDQVAHIQLSDGWDAGVLDASIEPLGLKEIPVACDGVCFAPPHQIEVQGLSRGAGFRVTSDVPVSAYQWNTYANASYSVDASLLLPVTGLGETYIVGTWGAGPDDPTLPSQVTVVATRDGTHVSFIPSRDIPNMNGVGACFAGEETEPIPLDAYDVVAISPSAMNADLSGTIVKADRPVAVFGSHACADVPAMSGACDHLEEEMLPLSTWGSATVLARYAPRYGSTAEEDPALWRVIAGADNMRVVFDPPAPPPAGAEHTFEKMGDVLEFMGPTEYFASGAFVDPQDPEHPDAPFLAYQLMTGVTNIETIGGGDPMMIQAAPEGQYLDRYVFNTDRFFDYDFDYIVITKTEATTVELDCLGELPESGFIPVGSTYWEVGYFFIDFPGTTTGCVDGAHVLTASDPVGLSVIGTAQTISYGYLGGVGVRRINPVVVE